MQGLLFLMVSGLLLLRLLVPPFPILPVLKLRTRAPAVVSLHPCAWQGCGAAGSCRCLMQGPKELPLEDAVTAITHWGCVLLMGLSEMSWYRC